MKVNPFVFRNYDIRGIVDKDLDADKVEAVGKAYGTFLRRRKVRQAVVGRDCRLSGVEYQNALMRGLTAMGIDIIDLGVVMTQMVYFAQYLYQTNGGAMVTASHNPPEYNGFKVMRRNTEWVRGSQLKELVQVASTAPLKRGGFSELDIWPAYLEHVRSFVRLGTLKPLKVVVDAGNGMAGRAIPLLFSGLPFSFTPLFFELDGSFPNRPSNPLAPGASGAAGDKVREVGADVGIMFDGDTDRIFFLDEQGRLVPADVTLLLLAKESLHQNPGAAIAYNLICSRAVPEFIRAWGGQPIRTAVGYVNVSQALLEQGAVMGGELSAHYSFRANYSADSGMIAALLVLELLSREGKKLSDLVAELSPYAKAPEVNLTVANQPAALATVKQAYPDAEIDELDGVTVSYPDWWVNVRPSNTEPLIRITVEAKSRELMEQKRDEVVKLIQHL